MEPSKTLPSRIRESRRAKNISRAELARRIGVKPSAAAQWEYPRGTRPTVQNLLKIALVTDVSFEWLATGRGVAIHRGGEMSAFRQEDFAKDVFEEQLLHLGRELPFAMQEPLLALLRAFLKKKS